MTASEKEKAWEDHWATQDTPWDAGESSPALRKFVTTQTPSADARARALVPGCGRGWDVFTLATHGYTAVGLDIAPSAAPHFEKVRKDHNLNADQASLVVGDFFEFDTSQLGGTFELIWDYTFYCAISPDQRDAWRDRMAQLLKPSGTLALLLYPVVPGAPRDQGPPYPLDPEEVTQQLSPRFERVHLEKVTQSHPGREGKEWLALFRIRAKL